DEVKMEYVLLSPDTLGAQTTVDPDEVKKQYEANMKAYGKPEERQAAHILIAVSRRRARLTRRLRRRRRTTLRCRPRRIRRSLPSWRRNSRRTRAPLGRVAISGSSPATAQWSNLSKTRCSRQRLEISSCPCRPI